MGVSPNIGLGLIDKYNKEIIKYIITVAIPLGALIGTFFTYLMVIHFLSNRWMNLEDEEF